MASNNKVFVKGNLGRDPETRQTNGGTTVCRFTVATNEKWKDRNSGQAQEHTEWHIIKAFGRQGEVLAQHLKAGDQIIIWGKLRTNKWKDQQTGADRQATEVHVDEFEFVGGRQSGGNNQHRQQQPPQQTQPQQPQGPQQAPPQQQRQQQQPQGPQQRQQQPAQQQPAPAGGFDDFYEDDIPF